MGISLQKFNYNDLSGGLDLKSSPTKTPENKATNSLNVDYSTDGAVFTRLGTERVNDTQSDQLRTLAFYDYKKSDGTAVQVIAQGTTLKSGLSSLTTMVSGLDDSVIPDFEFFVTPDNEYLIWGNGIDPMLKYDGTTWTNLFIEAPANPTVSDAGGGSLAGGDYSYYMAFVRYDVGTGVIQQYSDLNPVAQDITIAASHDIDIDRPASPDTQSNGWVIYRKSPTSAGVYYQLVDGSDEPVIIPIATTTYTDSIDTDGTIEAQFDNQPPPNTAVFEEFLGRMYYAEGPDLRYSKFNLPWAVPTENDAILSGGINCLKRVYNQLVISTSNANLWYLGGDIEIFDPQRISSEIGILNNRCAVGDAQLYIFATNRKVYYIRPTDFEQSQIRINEPLTIEVDPYLKAITGSHLENVNMAYYSKANVAKVMISLPVGVTTNDQILIFNETQSQQQKDPCWQIWDNIRASAIGMFNINGEQALYSGDFNGFIWEIDSETFDGDGAEINGTVTAATSTTLTQLLISSTATSGGSPNELEDTAVDFEADIVTGDWLTTTGGTGSGQNVQVVSIVDSHNITVTPNWGTIPDATTTYTIGPFEPSALIGINVRLVEGTGDGQNAIISANTNTTLTFPAMTTTADTTTVFSVGSYVNYHFMNWKSVTGDYDALKQLWLLMFNLNAAGDYNIDLIIQTDFDTSESNSVILLLNLSAANAIWGEVTWGEFIWGAFSVFQDVLRVNQRFFAIRIAIRSKKAGQPFQLNRFGMSVQSKETFFKSTLL